VHALRPEVDVVALACPLFVPLAEEGWWDHPVTHEVARLYLEPFTGDRVDTLILGCTHYPLLRGAIARAVGGRVRLVDSAEAVAGEVVDVLARGALAGPGSGSLRLLVTDAAARITRIAHLILPDVAVNLELVDLPD